MPVPAPATRPPDEWRDALLSALRERGGVLREACRAAGVSKTRVYVAMQADPGLRAEVEAARAEGIEEGLDRAETELLRRAIDGVERPVYQGGDLVGHVIEYSDTLLLAYLNAHGTGRGYYRHSRVELTGRDGGPVAIAADSDGLDREERMELRDMLRAERARRVGAGA